MAIKFSNTFLLRKLHQLVGIVPLGLFFFVHLFTNSKAMNGVASSEKAVKDIHEKSGYGWGQSDNAAGLGHELSWAVCGICTMVIDGRVRQSCSALIDDLLLASGGDTVTLQPMSKFPNVRDLKVDRSKMFDHLKHFNAWIELDGSYNLGPGPPLSNEVAQERLCLLTLHDLRLLSWACPQYGDDNYIGPQAIAQARLFNMHPVGKMEMDERLNGLMGDDGITNCGNAQNCVQVCPMSIPLTKAIYETNRDITVNALFGWLKK